MLPPHTTLRGGCARRILISSPIPWICLQNKPEVVAISMVVTCCTSVIARVMDTETLPLVAWVFLLWKRQNISSACVCSMGVLGSLMKTLLLLTSTLLCLPPLASGFALRVCRK